MFRPPPKSTLFPYTTFFRSAIIKKREVFFFFPQTITNQISKLSLHPVYSRKYLEALILSQPVASSPTQPFNSSTADRKSTRLNSSHSQISYAVFCLKKNTLL